MNVPMEIEPENHSGFVPIPFKVTADKQPNVAKRGD